MLHEFSRDVRPLERKVNRHDLCRDQTNLRAQILRQTRCRSQRRKRTFLGSVDHIYVQAERGSRLELLPAARVEIVEDRRTQGIIPHGRSLLSAA